MPRVVITPESLAALGAERLAALLAELVEGDAALKRRLKLELEARDDPAAAARAVRKRLVTIGRSRSYVDWDRVGALAADLDAQRMAIATYVAPGNPKEAFELSWMLLGLADSLYERCDDSNGEVGGVLAQTGRDLAAVALAAKPDPNDVATRLFDALTGNDYGQFDGLLIVRQRSAIRVWQRLKPGLLHGAMPRESSPRMASDGSLATARAARFMLMTMRTVTAPLSRASRFKRLLRSGRMSTATSRSMMPRPARCPR
jgi:hypothetical protein